jgi:HTH-type transcriptional regulator/antitoxin HipB
MAKIRLRTPKDIGAIIKENRASLGLDQGELAKKAGVSRLWINQVERGKPGASLGLILRTLAAARIELTAEAAGPKAVSAKSVTTPDITAVVQAARAPKRP